MDTLADKWQQPILPSLDEKTWLMRGLSCSRAMFQPRKDEANVGSENRTGTVAVGSHHSAPTSWLATTLVACRMARFYQSIRNYHESGRFACWRLSSDRFCNHAWDQFWILMSLFTHYACAGDALWCYNVKAGSKWVWSHLDASPCNFSRIILGNANWQNKNCMYVTSNMQCISISI